MAAANGGARSRDAREGSTLKPAVDSSVVVAAFLSWHGAHAQALAVINDGARLPAHAGFETYSVLTRLPSPNRADPDRVVAFLNEAFGNDWITLPGPAHAALVRELAERGITGGATYDAIIGATAKAVGARLWTCDRRALPVYARLGVEVELIG